MFKRIVGICVAVSLLVAGCGGASGGQSTGDGGQAASGDRVSIGGAGEALVWGDQSNYGAVMSHGAAYDAASWKEQGTKIADDGIIALATEDNSPESLTAAAQYLKKEYGVRGVALMGDSAGGRTAIQAAAENRDAFDQLILLSPAGGDASQLPPVPKLFIYSEEESLADSVEQMADKAPGDRNEILAVPSDAHAQAIFDGDSADRIMQEILDRLERFSGDG
jgi:pimeloyl-ACP methyl ester carboxylesterase